MKNIHVLTTDKPSRLVKLKLFGKDKYNLSKEILPIQDEEQYQQTYITSNEVIKVGDWFYNTKSLKPEPFKACDNGYEYVNCSRYSHNRIDCKKIILTDNEDLIKDGVQSIDDEFLEWFVNNPSCEEVKVEKRQYDPVFDFDFDENDLNYDGNTCYYPYKVIIPKEEHKQECKGSFKDCFNSLDKCVCDIMKQETLEKFIEKTIDESFEIELASSKIEKYMNLAVKWQQERMYSDMEEYAGYSIECFRLGEDCLFAKEWFEKFKNK